MSAPEPVAAERKVSFTKRLATGTAHNGKTKTLPEGWNDPVPTTEAIAGAYGLCNVMYGTKACSCQKARRVPCAHMAAGVAIVLRHTAKAALERMVEAFRPFASGARQAEAHGAACALLKIGADAEAS